MTRRGFTFIEVLVVMAIIGILANLAVPATLEMRRRADAARIIGDFNAIRAAAFDYFAEAGAYPGTGPWGRAPRELVPSLPQGFTFRYGEVDYRWRSWSVRGALPGRANRVELVGLEIRSQDQRLLRMVTGLYGGSLAFGNARQITFVID